MKRKVLVPAATALLAGVLTFVLMRGQNGFCACGGAAVSRNNISFLSSELSLTEEQTEKISGLLSSFEQQLEASCARHCAARSLINRVLSDQAAGQDQEDAIVSELVRAYEAGERAALENIRDVRAVLNADQRKRFDELILKCVCKSCSGCGKPDTENGHRHCK